MSTKEYTKCEIEHLRMVNGIVNRLSNSSMSIKRYSLMVFTFVCGSLILNFKIRTAYLLCLSIFIFVMMILFDMYYLSMERTYRAKFRDERILIEKSSLFDLSIGKIEPKEYFKTVFSKSILLFYLPLMIVMLTLYFLA